MDPDLYCLMCKGGELELAPKSTMYICKDCSEEFRVCIEEAACPLLPKLQEQIKMENQKRCKEAKKELPPLIRPLMLCAYPTKVPEGKGIFGLGGDFTVPPGGTRRCTPCRNAHERAKRSARSAVQQGEAAGADEPESQGPEPEPGPELQTCLGHLLEDGCAKDAHRPSGLCKSCDDKFKKQFASATRFLRWQLELAILGTNQSFTGNLAWAPDDMPYYAKLVEASAGKLDTPATIWNRFGVGEADRVVTGGRELTEGVRNIHANIQVMYEQAKELSSLPAKPKVPQYWFELGDMKTGDSNRPRHKYTVYPKDIDAYAPRRDHKMVTATDHAKLDPCANLLRGAALTPDKSHAGERGCFYLQTLAYSSVPTGEPPYWMHKSFHESLVEKLQFEELFVLLREAFCSPERYVMQDALLPVLNDRNSGKQLLKYEVGLVRIGGINGRPRAARPRDIVVLAKADLRRMGVICHPDDGLPFVHDKGKKPPTTQYQEPADKRQRKH